MIIVTDPKCQQYVTPANPERPSRVADSEAYLKQAHPDWQWRRPELATKADALLAHTEAYWDRLVRPHDFDWDTAYHEGIREHALRSLGAALGSMDVVLADKKNRAFSLMRPPGHHACQERAMGFCYLSNIAICALSARKRGIERVAIWDFDAHHGNGTEAIVMGKDGIVFASVHQDPCYPGTGQASRKNCWNYPVPPWTSRREHMDELAVSWEKVLKFKPELVLVSAGFDAYAQDPITQMTLEHEDFAELGRWLRESGLPAVSVLEGGYSDDLPELIDAFLIGSLTLKQS